MASAARRLLRGNFVCLGGPAFAAAVSIGNDRRQQVQSWSHVLCEASGDVQSEAQGFRRWKLPSRNQQQRDELKKRLIKHTDFIYSCMSHGKLEDSYTLERELGWGSFGTIYLARHKVLGYQFAVKKLKNSSQDPAQRDMLMNEVHALMDLDHPNVVKLVRYFDEGRDMYLVFELCEGPDLGSRLEDTGKMEEQEVASVLRQMLAALKSCHDHYIGHFDVKPENFMYRSKDMAKLKMIDLGLSSSFKKSKSEIRGTAEYMAPEVWDGFYGPEADVWSCGIVLFAMLTGKPFFPMFKQEEEIKQMARDRNWVRRRLRFARESGASKEAYDLLASMLRHDRHKRLTIREALHHPFFQLWNERAACEALRRRFPQYAEVDRQAQQVLDNLSEQFLAFAAEPVLVRAALLLMAHIGAYTFEETRPQRAAFAVLDRAASGGLSMEELENYYMQSDAVLPKTLEDAFSGVDVDDDGYITYVEFLSATLPRSVRQNEKLCRVVFDLLDCNRDGFVDASDLAGAFMNRQDRHGVCRESLAEVCVPSGRLSWESFLGLMSGATGFRTTM